MNFLFVVPRFAAEGNYYNYPIGIASVYAYVKRAGFSVSCLNLCHTNKSVEETLRETITSRDIQVVCTGGVSLRWVLIDDIVSLAKKIRPEVLTVVGGPITTAEPQLALDNMSIDIGVRGEGELTMAELAAALQQKSDLRAVKGIIFRDQGGNLVTTPEREAISNLDSLPFPEYEEFGFASWTPLLKYAQQITVVESLDTVRYAEIVGSRSCPFSCTFCYHPLGKKYRQRSLDNIFQEIDYLTQTFGVNIINFCDELFSADQSRMYEFAARIKKYNIRWLAQLRVNDVTRDLLLTLKDSGILYATFGIESLNDDVLKSMKKQTTRAEIESALALARETRFYCSGNIILGDPADDRSTLDDTISWWKLHDQYNVSISFILTIPNAPIYQYALEKGIITDRLNHARSKFPLVNLSKLSDREYYRLVLKVTLWNITRKYSAAGKLLESQKLTEQFKGRNFYSLKVQCPFCGDIRSYKKFMAGDSLHQVMVCDSCFASFKIPQKKAFYDDYSFCCVLLSAATALLEVYTMRFRVVRNHKNKIKEAVMAVASVLRPAR